ncbi:MAG: SlyX family protein [Ferrovibrio sp.]|uniref:SlyX family protein n=1 Tax=Ferrovibrio sp. TaxID=1917215 RepID=UPI002629F0E8|nr:SlyX family protein [Ferrovibrio sp.]MCW0234070.1 SlyX family protein [Ferrovibrio sp.]
MGTDNASDRIDTLEVRIAYQDETIEALNQTITKQWAQIDKLTRQVESLTGRLSEIEAKSAPGPMSERPPHY